MKRCILQLSLAASVSVAALLPSPAAAENLFLLQLGVFQSRESAAEHLNELEKQQNELLLEKRYLLRGSRPLAGGETTWRVLVGPFENRKQASRRCSEIKDKGSDCFVVETAAVNLEEMEKNTRLAVKSAKESAPESGESSSDSAAKSTSAMPWNWFGKSEDNSAVATASNNSEDAAAADASEQTSAASNRTNINTYSVYPTGQTAKVDAALPSLVDDITGLFTGGESDAATETAEAVTEDTTEAQESTASTEIENEAETATSVSDEAPRAAAVEIAEAIPVPLTDPADVPMMISEAPPAEAATPEKPALLDVSLPPSEEAETAAASGTAPDNAASPSVSGQSVSVGSAQPGFNDSATKASGLAAPIVVPTTTTTIPAIATPAKPVDAANANTSRLLQVSVFANDRDAFQCLTQVQSSVPGAGVIRTRMIKSTIGQAVVRFGPINDNYLEAEICEAVKRCSAGLNCRIMNEQRPRQIPMEVNVGEDGSTSVTPVDMTPRRDYVAPTMESPAAQFADAQEKSATWVQLGTSSSESDAQSRYAGIQQQNADILSAYTPTISSPENNSLAGDVYRLRIGPFDSRMDAQRICATLSSRGVGCLVLSK